MKKEMCFIHEDIEMIYNMETKEWICPKCGSRCFDACADCKGKNNPANCKDCLYGGHGWT